MNKKIKMVLGMLLFAAFILTASFGYNYLADKEDLPQDIKESKNDENTKEKAPDFTVLNKDGEEVKLSSFEGKPVLLNFWASWCGPCKSEMPDFQETYEEYGDDINYVILNLTDGTRETMESALEFINEEGYTFPVYFDTQLEAANTYGIMYIPTSYFIDSEGYIISKQISPLSYETLVNNFKTLK